ncbi:MAG: histidine kinase [Clostridium sp.]|nr:histidine kinase [Clostridium sp.]
MRVKKKIMMLFTLIAIIPVVVISYYYNHVSYNNMKETVSLLSNRIIKQTEEGITDRIISMEQKLHMSVNNSNILDVFMELPKYDAIKASFEEEKVAKQLDTIIYNTPYLKSIILDLYDYKTLSYGEGGREGNISDIVRYLSDDDFKNGDYYKKAKENTNEPLWISEINDNDNNIYLMKEFKYFMYAKKMGVVIFVIDEAMLGDYIKNKDGVDIVGNNTVIDIDSKKIIVGDKIDIDGMNIIKNTKIDDYFKANKIDTNKDLIAYSAFKNNWLLINTIPEEIIFQGLNKTRTNTIIFIIIGTIISVMSGVIISRNTERKLSRLIGKFEKVEKGDFSIDIQIDDDDEYGLLEEHFNNMVNELDILIKDNYLSNLESKEAHLNALQYQINPHFLYNTLEVINSIAATYKAKEIRDITQNLGSMFRYNISGSGNDITTLDKEINHIKKYIYLHGIHLPFKIQAFYNIEKEAVNAKILKFTMQPIIENIIKYGFRDRYSDGCIEINAEVNKNLIITIQDDGIGMNDDRLQEVLRNISFKEEDKKIESKGIGLRNIQERIKLNFGEEYGINIISSEDIGTTIIIEIPYMI